MEDLGRVPMNGRGAAPEVASVRVAPRAVEPVVVEAEVQQVVAAVAQAEAEIAQAEAAMERQGERLQRSLEVVEDVTGVVGQAAKLLGGGRGKGGLLPSVGRRLAP